MNLLRVTSLLTATLVVSTFAGMRLAKAKPQRPNRLNIIASGRSDQAMDQAKLLLEQLKANSWQVHKIDRSLLRVSDQDFAENPDERGATYSTFALPVLSKKDTVYTGQVALYTKLYTRNNFQVVPGREGETRPEGYFIVGWMDGRVVKVPIGDVRMFPIAERTWAYVFPGMTQYDSNLRRLAESPLPKKSTA